MSNNPTNYSGLTTAEAHITTLATSIAAVDSKVSNTLAQMQRNLEHRLETLKCDGSELLRWLYKVQEYFQFYDTPPYERLRCIALMLQGSAAD